MERRIPSLFALVSMLGLVACDKAPAEGDAAVGTAKAEVKADAEVKANAEIDANAEVDADADADADAEVEATIEADAFDLEAAANLVIEGKVETAEQLEVALNASDNEIHRVDIDADGKIDPLLVVEERAEFDADAELDADAEFDADAEVDAEVEVDADAEVDAEVEVDADADAEVHFQVLAVPSGTAKIEHAVHVATLELRPIEAEHTVELHADYGAAVVHSAHAEVHHRFDAKFEANAVLVVGLPFVAWSFTVDRPVYYAVYASDHYHVRVPPGHLKHGHWKATGHLDAHGAAHGGGGAKVKIKGKSGASSHGSAGHSVKSKGKGKGGISLDASIGGKAKTSHKSSASIGSGKSKSSGKSSGKSSSKSKSSGKSSGKSSSKSKGKK